MEIKIYNNNLHKPMEGQELGKRKEKKGKKVVWKRKVKPKLKLVMAYKKVIL